MARLFTIQQGSCVHQGTPSRLLFPVGVHRVYQIIQLEDQSLAQMHNTMLTVLGTVMCMRVKEMDQLQICDVLWHFDAAFHIMYAQTLAYSTCKGQVPRRRLQCSPVIGMTASQQPNSHRDTGPDPRGWAPVTGSRHSRPGPLGRRGSSSGRRRRCGPALEAAKTCGQED